MNRLYRQIYLTIIASLVLVVIFAVILWQFAPNPGPARPAFEMAGELVAALIPPADAEAAIQQEAIDRLHGRLKLDLTLFDKDLRPIAAAGRRLPKPRRESGGWLMVRAARPGPSACRTAVGWWPAPRRGRVIR